MKKRYSIILVVVLMLALVAGLTACALNVSNVEASEETFVKEKEVVIAHITDTHYYPLAYCYENSDITGSDYEHELIGATKPVAENHLLNVEALKQILKAKPDYVVVTGDITFDAEIQSHIEMGNLLRKLQNDIRAAGKPNFQVFVSFGNHDMYNLDPESFRSGKRKSVTQLVTREDLRIIYGGLGFPNVKHADFEAFYSGLSFVYEDRLPYTPDDGTTNYIYSENSSSIAFTYQWDDESIVYDNPVGKNGSLTYVADCDIDGYTFISIDEEVSDNEINHHVGGNLYEGTKIFLNKLKDEGAFQNRQLFSLTHHNLVPHFKGEDQILKDFTIYGWKENLDFFTDLGIQYNFSGHMHANDIATETAFNGKRLTDIETAATIGYNGGVRYCTIQHGKIGAADASNLLTRIELIKSLDLTDLINKGYINQYYLDYLKLAQFVEDIDGRKICTNPSDYINNMLFLNIVDVLKSSFINPQSILSLVDDVEGALAEAEANATGFIKNILGTVKDIAKPVILNIIDHMEKVVLKDYVYEGPDVRYQGEGQVKKLCGFVDDVLEKALAMNVAKDLKFFDFAMGAYNSHVAGTDIPSSALSDSEKEAFQKFYSGEIIKELFDILLDKETGIYKVVAGLTLPIDLAKGLTEDQKSTLQGVFNLVSTGEDEVDLHALVLDDIVPRILDFAQMFGINFSLEGKKIMAFLDHTIEGYMTESLYKSLGEIAGDILYNFKVDETAEYENNFGPTPVLYKYNPSLSTTHSTIDPREIPSVENGKLPSMITVTFGEDPAADKNFVWFTDPRVLGTDIQYMEGPFFRQSEAITVSGEYELYDTTTPAIDLGIFATLQYVNTARHTVKLTGLDANTTYSYRVGSAEDDYWSREYTFKTAPVGDDVPFSMLLVTDLQGSSRFAYEEANKVMDKARTVFGEKGYDFVINCGDLVDNSENALQWGYLLDIMHGHWGYTTQVIASGNHEKHAYKAPGTDKLKDRIKSYTLMFEGGRNDAYNYATDMHYEIAAPAQDRSSGVYYSFDYSGVHFTVLNTNDTTNESGLGEAQVEWLKEDLDATTQKHKIVIMHKGIYTAGSHSKDLEVVKMREQLTPIFAEKGVSLVLQGHDHTYSESYYLDAEGNPVKNNSSDKTKIGDQGTLYVTLGTLGEKYYNFVENENVSLDLGPHLHKPTLSNSTFGKLTFDGESLYYQGYEYDASKDVVTPISATTLEWWQIGLIAGLSVLITGAIAAVSASIGRRKSKKE